MVTDSSKGAAGALLLRLMPVDFTVIDLQRDAAATIQSNGVARSWDGVDSATAPPSISGARLAGTQASISFATRVLHPHVQRVAFEEFLSERDGEALTRTHQCEGNPSRFGELTISATEATPRGHASVTARAEAAAIAALRLLGR